VRARPARPLRFARSLRLAALALVPLARGAPGDPEAERELRARVWAHDPVEHADALAAALSEPTWEERGLAAEALARGLAAGAPAPGGVGERVTPLLADPHPNVRARALQVLAALGRDARIDPEAARRLADDSLPLVRLALVDALVRTPCEAAPELLERLARDPDARVADGALAGLFALGPEAAERRAARFAELAAGDDEAALLRAARGLIRGGTDARRELAAARGRLGAAAGSATGARGGRPGGWLRGRLALLAAVSFATGGPRTDALFDGWIAGVAAGGGAARRALLAEALARADAGLGRDALLALDDVLRTRDGLPPRRAARWPGLVADVADVAGGPGEPGVLHAPYELAETIVQTLSPDEALAAMHDAELAPATVELLLGRLAARLDALDPGRESRWLAPGTEPAVRRALVDAAATVFAAHGDPGAGELLLRGMEDEDGAILRTAFVALATGADPGRWLEPLHAAWRRRDPDERFALVDAVDRGVVLTPFRADFLELGRTDVTRRRQAVERLAAFRGDPVAIEALSVWLAEELGAFAALGPDADPDRLREAELWVKGGLRALDAAAGEAAVPEIRRVLERSIGASVEIGKTAAQALGQSAAGRRELPAFLGPAIDGRTRVEAALQLAGREEADERVVGALLAGLPRAAPTLRMRVVEALGRCADRRTLAALEELVLGAGAGDARAAAARALGERPDAAAGDVLLRGAAEAPDPDARLACLRAAGLWATAPGAGAGARPERERVLGVLTGWFVAVTDAGGAGSPAERVGAEERGLWREALLEALAGGMEPGGAPEGSVRALAVRAVEARWLQAALAEVEPALRARFRGEELPAVAFQWRSELAVAERLARAGRLEAALAAAGPWPGLDARFLSRLARRVAAVEGAEAVALALERAALVGYLGEAPDPEELQRSRLVALVLAWRAERFDACARLAGELEVERRTGELSDALLAEAFGATDRALGADPAARLASLAPQARARAALARGDLPQARIAADEARARLGASAAARRDQERLDALLAEAGHR